MVYLCIKNEIFEHGSLRFSQQSSGSKSYTFAAFTDLMNKIREVDPRHITYTTWLKYSIEILGWSAKEASLCFEMFQIFCRLSERVLLGEDTKGAPLTCTHLALFLFTQLYVRQPSKPVADDMWVDNSRSPQANNTPSSPPILTSPTKRLSSNASQLISEETNRINFVLDNEEGMFGLVFGPIDLSKYIIPNDIINDFEFLFSGGFNYNEEVVHLCDLLPSKVRKDTGVVAKDFRNWLHNNLKVYDQASLKSSTEGTTSESASIPKTPVIRPLVIQNISRSMYNPTPSKQNPQVICIYDCLKSHIFLLRDAKFVHISGCQKCLIMIGCVSKAVTVQNCEDCRIVTICRRLRIANCLKCSFEVFTTFSPVVFGDCRLLTFAPHSAPYSNMWKDIHKSGVVPGKTIQGTLSFNRWDHEKGENAIDPEMIHEKQSSLYPATKLPPEEFSPFTVPESSPPPVNTLPLPPEYLQVIQARRTALLGFKEKIKDLKLEEDDQNELNAAIQSFFREWLVQSGKIDEIINLVNIETNQSK